jgi:hypothetical protein
VEAVRRRRRGRAGAGGRAGMELRARGAAPPGARPEAAAVKGSGRRAGKGGVAMQMAAHAFRQGCQFVSEIIACFAEMI